jgi:hypothetical protein
MRDRDQLTTALSKRFQVGARHAISFDLIFASPKQTTSLAVGWRNLLKVNIEAVRPGSSSRATPNASGSPAGGAADYLGELGGGPNYSSNESNQATAPYSA